MALDANAVGARQRRRVSLQLSWLLPAALCLFLQGCREGDEDDKQRILEQNKAAEMVLASMDLSGNYTGTFKVNETWILEDCTGQALATELNRIAKKARQIISDAAVKIGSTDEDKKIQEKHLDAVIPLDAADQWIYGNTGVFRKDKYCAAVLTTLPDASLDEQGEFLKESALGSINLSATFLPENRIQFKSDKNDPVRLKARKKILGFEDIADEVFIKFREQSMPVREESVIATLRSLKIFAMSGCLLEYYEKHAKGDQCSKHGEPAVKENDVKDEASAATTTEATKSAVVSALQTRSQESPGDAPASALEVNGRGRLQHHGRAGRSSVGSRDGALEPPKDARDPNIAPDMADDLNMAQQWSRWRKRGFDSA